MITYSTRNQGFIESSSPHSIGLANNVTVPNPGWDSNALIRSEKSFQGRTNSNGFSGLRGLGDLFSGGLDVSTWGIGEWSTIGVGLLMLYMVWGKTPYDSGSSRPYVKKGHSYRRIKRYVGDKGYLEEA